MLHTLGGVRNFKNFLFFIELKALSAMQLVSESLDASSIWLTETMTSGGIFLFKLDVFFELGCQAHAKAHLSSSF